MLGGSHQLPAAPNPALSLLGSLCKLHWSFFCLAYSLEQTGGEACEGGNARTWLLPFWKPGAPQGAQLGTGQAQGHSSACKTS